MEDLGLNPDDDQENYNTPVGIGNLCGNNVVRDRLDDGVNQVNIRLLPYPPLLWYQFLQQIIFEREGLSSSLLNIICCQIWYQRKSDYMDRA